MHKFWLNAKRTSWTLILNDIFLFYCYKDSFFFSFSMNRFACHFHFSSVVSFNRFTFRWNCTAFIIFLLFAFDYEIDYHLCIKVYLNLHLIQLVRSTCFFKTIKRVHHFWKLHFTPYKLFKWSKSNWIDLFFLCVWI